MISVAIATLDRPEMVRRIVGSLLRGTRAPAEVIVVDGSRGCDTRDAVEALGSELVRYFPNPARAASIARNTAVRLASADYVAFLDDDCLVPASWVEKVERQLELHDRPDALYGEVRAPPDATDRKGIALSVFEPPRTSEWSRATKPQKLGFSNHMIVKRSSFRELGGFDERLGPGTPLYGAEDMDYGYRLLKLGQRAVTTPEIWVIHDQWRPQGDLPKLLYRYNLGHAAFCMKHVRAGDRYPWRLFAIQVGGDLKMLGSAARRRSWLRARVSTWRARGSWAGLVYGWRTFRPQG